MPAEELVRQLWHAYCLSTEADPRIVATRDIEPDTTLFEIPRPGIINVQTSHLPSRLPGIFDKDGQPLNDEEGVPKLDSWSSLILVMIYEYLRGAESSWKPYFDVLPEAFNTPMFWSNEEVEELQASPARAKIGKADAEEMFRAHILPVIRSNPDVFSRAESHSDDDLISLAHRMGSTIMAYAFDLENEDGQEENEEEEWVEDRDGKTMMGMVPMADILNADAEFNAHINHGDESLTATSLRTIKAGEEVLNYYGPHPNSELLRRYGYVTEKHSRYDVVEIPWFLVEEALAEQLAIALETVEAIRRDLDEDELEDTFVLERESGEPNPDGTFATQASLSDMPGDLREQLKEFLKAIKKLQPESIPDKRKRDEVQQAVLLRVLQKLGARYTTSSTEDALLLQQNGLPERSRMAAQVRLGEKKLLQEAIALMDAATDRPTEEDSSSKRAKTSA